MQRTTTVTSLALLLSLALHAQEDDGLARFETAIKAEQFAEIATPLASYTEAHPKSWQAFYQLGYVDFRLHRFHDSVNMLCKSLVLKTDFAESHKILAFDLNILGRPDLAVRELERALTYDPASAESHYELGRISYEQGSHLKAIEHLEKAKSLSPGYVRAYHNLGLAYSAIGDNGKAVTNFEEALRLNSLATKRSAWPYIDYATYFNMQNNFAKARDLLLQAIGIEPSWDQEYDELSKAYRGLGQTDEAITALKHAVALNPSKPEYHYVLARLFTQTHQSTEAKEQLALYERQKTSTAK